MVVKKTKPIEKFTFTIEIPAHSVMDSVKHARQLGNTLNRFARLGLSEGTVVKYKGNVVPFVDLDHEIGISGE